MTSFQGGNSRNLRSWILPNMALMAGLWLALGCWVPATRAALQFDVFLGYDNLVREANWFPVACEIFNDGPTFTGVFELTSEAGGRGQARRYVLELPTNTRKRFVIPVFGSGGRYGVWNARLLDQHGRTRGEVPNLRPRREVSWETVVLGALPRTFGGLPTMPEVKTSRNDLQPAVARLQADYFPDNPIALEGLDALYLNSEKALDLKVNQVNALLAWLNGGGHLIVGVEQPGDVNGTPWLRNLLPCQLTGVATIADQTAFHNWLTAFRIEARHSQPGPPSPPRAGGKQATVSPANPYATLGTDLAFTRATLPVAECVVRGGTTVLSSSGRPMVIEVPRGRGKVTVLAFSPEREPFRSWKNRPWFWARLLAIPPDRFAAHNMPVYGGHSIDGVFGAMIDSRQIRKLPVSGLLLLLVVYLLVIGPVDQFWLKKINRQMLTWITFPCYVVLFSLLIYGIGFVLRAGETEWNELQVVDLLPRGERADWRGRTYVSVYSPANARYQLVGDPVPGHGPLFATLRGEFQGAYMGQESSRTEVEQRGDGFRAEIFVPVWTSQLYVNDWLQPGAQPFTATVRRSGNRLTVTAQNQHVRDLTEARLIIKDRVYLLGTLPRSQTKTFQLDAVQNQLLTDFVKQQGTHFAPAVQQRHQAFGGQHYRLEAVAANAMAASFVSELRGNRNTPYDYQSLFVMPARFDLSSLVERGDAVLLAWDAGHALSGDIHRFKPRRSSRNTLLRLAVPVSETKAQ